MTPPRLIAEIELADGRLLRVARLASGAVVLQVGEEAGGRNLHLEPSEARALGRAMLEASGESER